jgi:hypothetical protein
MKRALWGACLLGAVLFAITALPLDFLRPRVERAIQMALGRKVEIGAVHFTLLPGVLPGPGFTLDSVTIHEDPRAGIEPFAYMDSLGATVRLSGLFTGRLEFSLLNLGDATINLVKSSEGPWNFQYLLESASANKLTMPSIRIRGGRVNFKFGDTKSVFYFNDADLNVSPYADGSLELRFGGAPSRTDRAAQEFGRLFVRGHAAPGYQQLNFTVELEKSSLEEALQFVAPGGAGVHGNVSLQAQLSGSPSRLDVSGNAQVTDIHRWDLLPSPGSSWQVPFKGALDLAGERLDLTSPPDDPFALRFRAEDWLGAPRWSAAADLHEIPLSTLLKIARHMGVAYPEPATVEGSLSGMLNFDGEKGLAGNVDLSRARLILPDSALLAVRSASIELADGSLHLKRTLVRVGERHSAELEASYKLSDPRELELRVFTRGLNIKDAARLGLAAVPVLRDVSGGVWRGSAGYKGGKWSGEFDIQDAKIAVDGLAAPVRIASAAVALSGERVSVTKLHGSAGKIDFTGSYRWDGSSVRPHKLVLALPEADAGEIQKLFALLAPNQGGLLSRTLRWGGLATVPEWLANRHAEATLTIGVLTSGDWRAHAVSGKLLWDGPVMRLADLTAKLDPGTASGSAQIALDGKAPWLHLEGQLQDIAWHGGTLDLEATGEGNSLEALRWDGTLRGRGIGFAPDAEFRTAAASFVARGFGPLAKWTLTNVEVNQGGELLTGSGATQPDGKLALELTGRGKQVRYAAAVFAGVQ